MAIAFENADLCAELACRGLLEPYADMLLLPLGAPLELYRRVGDAVGESRLGVMLPAVVLESEYAEFVGMLREARESGVSAAMVSNLGQIDACRELGFKLLGGARLNVLNGESRKFLEAAGLCEVALSQELTLPQARDIGGLAFTLGRVPLMITERCFIKENFGCKSCFSSRFPLCFWQVYALWPESISPRRSQKPMWTALSAKPELSLHPLIMSPPKVR